jgi:PKD repeat protein
MEKSWFISRNGEQLGPYSWDEIVRQAEEGSLNPQEYIWSEGMKDWQSAQSMEGLFKAPEPVVDTPPPVSPQPVRPAMKRTAPKKNVMLPVVIAVAAILLVVGGVYAFSTLMQQAGSQNGVDETSEDWREHWPYLDEIQGLMAMRNGEQPPPVNGEPPDDETPPPPGGGGGTPPPGGGSTPTSGNPIARISVTPLAPRAGDPVTFSGHDSSSSSSGGRITNYSWEFSDGRSGTGVSFQRTFESAGFITVSLTVTDEQGKTGSTRNNIIVMSARTDPPANGEGPPANGGDPPANGDDPPPSGSNGGGTERTGFFDPTAKFTFSPAEPVVDQAVTFDASTSSSLNGRITKYEWVVGDSIKRFSSAAPTMTRSFTSEGNYLVKLTVTDSAGKTNTIERKVTIKPGTTGGVGQFPLPDINNQGERGDTPTGFTGFSISPTEPLVNQSISFTVNTLRGANIQGASYLWDFGDGTTQWSVPGDRVTKTYNRSGNYLVKLTVTDSALRSTQFTKTVSVKPIPARIRIIIYRHSGTPGNETQLNERYWTDNLIEIRNPATGRSWFSTNKRFPGGDRTYGFDGQSYAVEASYQTLIDQPIPSSILQNPGSEFAVFIESRGSLIYDMGGSQITENNRLYGKHDRGYCITGDQFTIASDGRWSAGFTLNLVPVSGVTRQVGSVNLSGRIELY